MNFESALSLCRTFPGAAADIKWDCNLVFSVATKMFAVTNTGKPTGISFKVEDDRFLELTDRQGIVPAPYLARAKWVYVEDANALGDDEAAQLLRRSYELVFAKLTKKVQKEIVGG